MQSQVEVVLQQLLGVPVRHPGFEGLGQAPPEEDQEAGLLCRRSPSDFPEAPGILLDAPISLTDVGELSCWTHVVLARFCHGTAREPVEKVEIWVQMQVSSYFFINSKANRQKQNNNQKRDTPDGNVVLVSRAHKPNVIGTTTTQ